MARVSVTELKNKLSEYLRRVKRGETIEVTERGRVVATLNAPTGAALDDDEREARLEREGILRRPSAKADPRWRRFEPVPCTGDAVQAVIESRQDRS
jgi:antitoxin (DNA-binding transcriptional repressor) of toxin-antitoxin stability system